MKQISLTRGLFALVDDEDFDRVNQFKWHASRGGTNRTFYALRRVYPGSPRKSYFIRLHREIMRPGETLEIDHINGDGLDNRRINLRVVSAHQNRLAHKTKKKGATSNFRGVSWHKEAKKWVSQITFNYAGLNLGFFKDEETAARAYDAKARELFGEFAQLNFT